VSTKLTGASRPQPGTKASVPRGAAPNASRRPGTSRPQHPGLGVVGSFVGGFVANPVEYHTLTVSQFHFAGILWSIADAIILLVLLRVARLEPGRGRSRRRGRWI